MDRDKADMVRLGGPLLADAFEAMLSSVRSDHSVLACRSGGWPQFLQEEAAPDEEPRRTFTPAQVKRAECLCEVFMGLRRHDVGDKRLALSRAKLHLLSWREFARVVGGDWAHCRRVYEGVVCDFCRAVARREGRDLADAISGL